MQPSAESTVHACAAAAHAGEIHFGELLRRLAEVGVASYHADYRGGSTRYYLPDDTTIDVALRAPDVPIADTFDVAQIKAAILGSQRGEVKYPEFLVRSRRAGCVGYIVWLAGRHVSYFGRRGEVHVERFPSSA